jgi:type IV pilus assembly protein PilY1
LALSIALTVAPRAGAQADLNPPPPNVLLLIDTSGSMEYKTSSNSFPLCRFDQNGPIAGAPLLSEKSRWTNLIEVLTGTISNYDCQTIDRSSTQFKNEYALVDGHSPDPYDFQYHAPYHRPMSGTCVVGPGPHASPPTSYPSWPGTPFTNHTYNSTALTGCTFQQNPDGMLDSFSTLLRFGLMTFDTNTSASLMQDGTFSYVVNNVEHQGGPVGCTIASNACDVSPYTGCMEVGARNPLAPPWEGRLIPFGDPSTGSTDYQTKNTRIQQVLLATRPFGGTPIAGMLNDARDFLWNDISKDPDNTAQYLGPHNDPYSACRDTYIVLLSDGQPNLDLRATSPGQPDSCGGTAGCPFDRSEEIAADLLTGGNGAHPPVKTFVVGFALNTLVVNGNSVDCSTLTTADTDTSVPTSLCRANPNNASLQACCALARIALAGDDGKRLDPSGNTITVPRQAYFANDPDQLRSDLNDIFSHHLPATSRTVVASSIGSSDGSNTGLSATLEKFTMLSSMTPNATSAWLGQLHRSRSTCDSSRNPVDQSIDATAGDVFEDNLTSNQGRARTFYSMQGTTVGATINSQYSIRPNLTADPDGSGLYSGTVISGQAAAFVAATAPESMGITNTTCVDSTTHIALSASACRDRYMKWLVGLDNGTDFKRCDTRANHVCSLLGDIYHSSPRMVNHPSEFVRDESYTTFHNAYATRPLMVYTSSNDGFLHAFKVATNDPNDSEKIQQKANNELWALIPPQVLPHIPAEYPTAHQFLLDGVPIVKDVVAKYVGSNPGYKYDLRRSAADAGNGLGDWRTILVQSFGGTYSGYFAVDITNPDPQQTLNNPNGSETGGPQFLWQLTTDSTGTSLFGTGSATPLITTLFFDDGDGTPQEYAVAVLSGGSGTDNGTSTPRITPSTTLNGLSLTYPPRGSVPKYTGNLGGRSLTVVRLDTGKIVRTFRQAVTEVPLGLRPRVIVSPLDSPITGQPIGYPSDTGSVSDRIFVGDQDGGLWRVDVSETDPSQWTMKLFWDTFPATGIHGAPTSDWRSGQPIQTPPILSVDDVGNISIAVSTGDQDAVGASSTMQNFVWSLVEHTSADRTTFTPEYHWLKQFLGGQRVTGPLSLFNRGLYFSTLRPPDPSAVCDSGTVELFFGMDYLNPSKVDASGEQGGDVTNPVFNAPPYNTCSGTPAGCITGTALLGTGQSPVIYGVPINQDLTCSAQSNEVLPDPYLGSGSHTALSNINPGHFNIIMQTGRGKAQSTGAATSAVNGSDNAAKIDLGAPMVSTHLDSWAAILE